MQKQKRKIEFISLSKNKKEQESQIVHEKTGTEIKILNKKHETLSLTDVDSSNHQAEESEISIKKQKSFLNAESDRKSPSNSAMMFKKATLTASKRNSLLMMEND